MYRDVIQHVDSTKYKMVYYNLFTKYLLVISYILNFATAFTKLENLCILDVELWYLNPLFNLELWYAVAGIHFSIFSLYVRNELKNYRKTVPMLISVYYLIYMGLEILYNVVLASIANINTDAKLFSLFIFCGILVLANHEYFSKRKSIFVYPQKNNGKRFVTRIESDEKPEFSTEVNKNVETVTTEQNIIYSEKNFVKNNVVSTRTLKIIILILSLVIMSLAVYIVADNVGKSEQDKQFEDFYKSFSDIESDFEQEILRIYKKSKIKETLPYVYIENRYTYINNMGDSCLVELDDNQRELYQAGILKILYEEYKTIVCSDDYKKYNDDYRVELLKDKNKQIRKNYTEAILSEHKYAQKISELSGNTQNEFFMSLFNNTKNFDILPIYETKKSNVFTDNGETHTIELSNEQIKYYDEIGAEEILRQYREVSASES